MIWASGGDEGGARQREGCCHLLHNIPPHPTHTCSSAPTCFLLPPAPYAPQFPTVGFEKAEMRYKN